MKSCASSIKRRTIQSGNSRKKKKKDGKTKKTSRIRMDKEKALRLMESTDLDFSTNLHNIMNGISSNNSIDMDVEKGDNKEEERSPAKKRGGLSISSTKHKGTHQVSPPKQESLIS